MTNHSPADCSSLNLPDLDALARQTDFVARSSGKLSPSTFLQTLCGAVTTGLCSMNQMAASLSEKIQGNLSAQAIHQRFSERSTAFLTAVSHQLMGEEITPGTGGWRGGRIQRILLEDSSVQAMLKTNANYFAAHGNHHGATAGIKIDLAYDMLSGQVVSHDIWAATEQDKTIGRELVAQVGVGDLVVRDMGYFCLAEFTEMERLGADWLSRVPLTLGIKTESGKPIEAHLRTTRSGVIDLKVRAGAEGKFCRLVAVRANRKVTAQRRKERRQEAKKNGGTPGTKALLRDGWHLMLTNLESEEFGAKALRALYRARWGIEIQFRAWKQSQNLDRAFRRKSGFHHLMALALASVINHLLGMKIGRLYRNRSAEMAEELSYEKLYDRLSLHQQGAKRWEEIVDFRPDPRHIRRAKRMRQSPVSIGALDLA